MAQKPDFYSATERGRDFAEYNGQIDRYTAIIKEFRAANGVGAGLDNRVRGPEAF